MTHAIVPGTPKPQEDRPTIQIPLPPPPPEIEKPREDRGVVIIELWPED